MITFLVICIKGDSANGTVSLMASFSQSARNLQGEEVLTSYQAPQEAFDMEKLAGEDIPLMPLVIKVHFVNNFTGEGVANVRKSLYKVSSFWVTNWSSVIICFS